MKEYIEREAVLALKEEIGAYGMDISSEKVKSIPAADVQPVARCGECKHNKGKKIWADGDETFDCANGHGYPPLDWFCADGEKMEEADGSLYQGHGDAVIAYVKNHKNVFLCKDCAKLVPAEEGE